MSVYTGVDVSACGASWLHPLLRKHGQDCSSVGGGVAPVVGTPDVQTVQRKPTPPPPPPRLSCHHPSAAECR